MSSGARGAGCFLCGLYAVLCPWSGGLCGLLSRVVPWSGGRFLFPAISRLIRVQVQSSRVQFGTKNDAAGYTLAEPRHISVKCGAGQSTACVKCPYKKGTLICRGSTRVYPVESLPFIFICSPILHVRALYHTVVACDNNSVLRTSLKPRLVVHTHKDY